MHLVVHNHAPIGAFNRAGRIQIEYQGRAVWVRINALHTVKMAAISSAVVDDLIFVDRRIPQWSVLPNGWRCNNWKYLAVHEYYEKHGMLAAGYKRTLPIDQQVVIYDRLHTKVATPAERAAVEADGGDWREYQAHMNGMLSRIERQLNGNPPPDPFLPTRVALEQVHHGRHAQQHDHGNCRCIGACACH